MLLTDIDSDVSTFIHQRTIEIKALMRRTTRNILEIGEKLIEVKERLGHGRFGEWLKAEFEWSQDTAERFMNVAKRLSSIPHDADFEARALYLLAAPSTPLTARQEALELADKGETVTHTKAKEIVSRHKATNADDEDLASFEAIANTPVNEVIVTDESDSNASEKAEELEPTDESDEGIHALVEAPKTTLASKSKSDLLPFHCLMSQQQQKTLFEAINLAKSNYSLDKTADALDAIAQEYLNAQ